MAFILGVKFVQAKNERGVNSLASRLSLLFTKTDLDIITI